MSNRTSLSEANRRYRGKGTSAPCYLFLRKGECNRGDGCRFQHVKDVDLAVASARSELHFLKNGVVIGRTRDLEQNVYSLYLHPVDTDVVLGLSSSPWFSSLVDLCGKLAHPRAGFQGVSYQRVMVGLVFVLTRSAIIDYPSETEVKLLFARIHPSSLAADTKPEFEFKLASIAKDLLDTEDVNHLDDSRLNDDKVYLIDSWDKLCGPIARFFVQIAEWFPKDLGHAFYGKVAELLKQMARKCENVVPLAEKFSCIRNSYPWDLSWENQSRKVTPQLTSQLLRTPARPLLGGPGEMTQLKASDRHGNDFVDFRRINLFPAVKELDCPVGFLPRKSPNSWHPLLHASEEAFPFSQDLFGTFDKIEDAALIDINFRLLREEFLDGIRSASNSTMASSKSRQPLRNRVILVSSRVDVAKLDRRSRTALGLKIVLSEVPKEVKKSFNDREFWEQTNKRWLACGSLCCIADVFAVVVSRELNIQKKELVLTVGGLENDDTTGLLSLVAEFNHSNKLDVRHVLDDFFAYWPVLLSLRSSTGLPFQGRLSSRGDSNAQARTLTKVVEHRPQYVSTSTRFCFDSLRLPGAPPIVVPVGEQLPRYDPNMMALDEDQYRAVRHCLENDIALVQGPPGTGKSYSGAALVRVLMDTFEQRETGPILCMCMTNHALDQFLNEILKTSETPDQNRLRKAPPMLVRLGARSVDPQMQAMTLQEHKKALGRSRSKSQKDIDYQFYDALKQDDNNAVSDEDVMQLIKADDPFLAQVIQQNYDEQITSGFEIQGVNLPRMSPLRFWIESHDVSGNNKKRQETKQQRHAQVNRYKHKLKLELAKSFEKIHTRHRESVSSQDLQLLRRADLVGVTTSKAAELHDVLRKLRPKIVLCEEAGEISEPQLLASLNQSTEHLILIGDHLQLRPKSKMYDLQRSSGKGFDLDVSTFERLIEERTCQVVTLATQRRMRPEISDLLRASLYPHLKDHTKVTMYDQVRGAKMNLVFYDHRFPEASNASSGFAMETSHGNELEANFAAHLALYFARQGYFQAGQLVILTPYLGQLRLIRNKLKELRIDDVVVGEQDHEDLESTENLKLVPSETEETTVITPTTLTETGIRIATVDNFQGEEGDIVIFSSVRNNSVGSVGFLGETNRCNVALSRARKGMFILGNADLLRNSRNSCAMWKEVLGLMETRSQLVSLGIPLVCSRHPQTETWVASIQDFNLKVRDGGCSLPCDLRLDCGHPCSRFCHPDNQAHVGVKCLKPCQRTCPQAGHPCKKMCYQACMCDEPVERPPMLSCGHVPKTLKCHQMSEVSKIKCTELVDKSLLCGHIAKNVPCWKPVASIQCDVPCAFKFPDCGHPCDVQSHSICDNSQANPHLQCPRQCLKPRHCDHPCPLGCNHAGPCPPCEEPCSRRCEHSRCPKKCFEACAPCCESRCMVSSCEHHRCSAICGAPCARPLCNAVCSKRLACGHPCPSLCGEPCPEPSKGCLTCAVNKNQCVDFVEFKRLEEVKDGEHLLVLECGHVFTVEYLDSKMGMDVFYGHQGLPIALDVSRHQDQAKYLICDLCRTVDHKVKRYNRITKLKELMRLSFNFLQDMDSKAEALMSTIDDHINESRRTKRRAFNNNVQIKKVKHWIRDVNWLLRVSRNPLIVAFPGVVLDERWKSRLEAFREALVLGSGAAILEFANRAVEELRCAGSSELLFVHRIRLALVQTELIQVYQETLEGLLNLVRSVVLKSDQGMELQRKLRFLEDDQFGAQRALEVMLKDFPGRGWTGQGHAMRCPNGHIYFIGNCGGAMEESRCPDCGARIGGRDHHLVAGNRAGL